jgi:beta-galactosidase
MGRPSTLRLERSGSASVTFAGEDPAQMVPAVSEPEKVGPAFADTPAAPALSFVDGQLLRDGRPHRILAGSLHYFRVHPAQWEDRLERLAALGVNAVDTYIPWNFHERKPGAARFDGWQDVEAFIRLAGDIGLDVVVRPGPYICAEWDNGGFPAWLTGTPGMHLRSSDPLFLSAVGRWFDELIPRIAALQTIHGGPVVAVQVENEYGSYGDDGDYLAWVRDALVTRGITELLYTADGPTELMQDGGNLDGVLATATFGTAAGDAAALLRSRRDGEPFMCAEFWNGWFDHWGERHNVRSAVSAAESVGEIVESNGSVSLYMAHGGTNFGLWAGANHDGSALQPTVTSYDSDAPIAENGALTKKFFTLRKRIAPGMADWVPDEPLVLAPRSIPVTRGGGLLDALARSVASVSSAHPPTFEELGIASGLVLYRATPTVPVGSSSLTLTGLHDRTIVFVDGAEVAKVDTVDAVVPLAGTGRPIRLELLVENQGRINYGQLLGQGKGILGSVQTERRRVFGWQAFAVPLDTWSVDQLASACASGPSRGSSGFATAVFEVDEPGDAFLAFPGFEKGFAWINGFLLGRYWAIGPQTTLYVPQPLLRRGENTLSVLELHRMGERIDLRASAELGPPREFVETFG